MSGWRTVVIDSDCSVKLRESNLTVTADTEKSVPIEQIRMVLINSYNVQISVKLINELIRNQVKIVFCNEKHNPFCEVTGYENNTFSAGRLALQTEWKAETKDRVWQKIVYRKIETQINMLKKNKLRSFENMEVYSKSILPSDSTNREAQAARVYFNLLFGYDFNRRTESLPNAALNYGYAILLSSVNRLVAIHGYHTAIGIKHSNCTNPYNLSCDLMEPFRPYVDDLVYNNADRPLDRDYKKELIALNYDLIVYGGRIMELQTALEEYVSDVFAELCGDADRIKELDFVA